MMVSQAIQSLIARVLQAGAVSIRNIDAGEEPFLYSSGNYGPGYVMIKGLVSHRQLFFDLAAALSHRIREAGVNPDWIAANATGGMIPGWLLGHPSLLNIPYAYVRGTRKLGGHGEYITGTPPPPPSNALVVEELVNYAETTCNSAAVLRDAGYQVTHGATVLYYGHTKAEDALAENGIQLVHLFTLSEVLDVGVNDGLLNAAAVAEYRLFLADPAAWMERRGLSRREGGGTQ